MPPSPAVAAFGSPVFRRFWFATLLSNFGTLIQTVGAGWMMTTLTDSRDMVALVQTSSTLPVMLFSLLSGALADSVDRRRLMLGAQVFMLATAVVLAGLAFAGLLTPWLLLLLTFLLGTGNAVHIASWQASVGDIVPREQIHSAVLMNSIGFNMMRSVGPAIGGAIVAAFGAAVAFVLNALSYVALIAALSVWKRPPTDRHLPREPIGAAISAGLRYVAMSPNILVVLARAFLFGLSAVIVVALLPIVARETLEGTPVTYGILLGCFGLGAIGTAVLNQRLSRGRSNEAMVRIACLAFATCCLILAGSRTLALSCVGLLLAGASWVMALSLFNVTVQLSTPRWVVGRAMSLYQAATFGGMSLGAWVWGLLAEAYGTPAALLLAAATLAATAAAGLWLRVPQPPDLDLDPLGRFSEPELRLDLRQRSGPIMVMVDYRIAQEAVPEFLSLMAARRRIRIRDGARHWALLRDLENPETWTESYHVATWVEYVRHNERRTKSDAEITERLRALHRGPGLPVVHRMIERQTVPRHDDTPVKYPEH